MSKIFCIGLSKTGTQSLAAALRILGYEGSHYISPDKYIRDLLFMSPEGFDWNRVIDGDFAADIPIPKYYRELDRQFPDSKFILTTRHDKDAWLESCRHEFDSVNGTDLPKQTEGDTILDNHSLVRLTQYGIVHFNKETLSDYYDMHNAGVSSYFGPDSDMLLRLGIHFGSEQKWDKLCKFLDKPIPDCPYPHKGARELCLIP